MAWGSLLSATQHDLDGASAYETIQRSAADWEITLNPGELAQVVITYTAEATPTEDLDVIIPKTADGTTYESDGEAERHILLLANSEADDPVIRSVTVVGVYGFQVRVRLRDTDDSAGGDDVGSFADVDIRVDGVSI